MEIENCNNLKYWEVTDKGEYCSIYCPVLNKGDLEFGVKRAIFVELKNIEKWIVGKYTGWNAYTKLKNSHIMRLFWKVGAKPYHMDLDADSIWFFKKIQRGQT
jgi:hypothetical protein